MSYPAQAEGFVNRAQHDDENHITVCKHDYYDVIIVIWIHIIGYELLRLDRNAWNHVIVCKTLFINNL